MAHKREGVDVDRVRNVVRDLAPTEGLDLVVLFGSTATDPRSARDLDLAVRGSASPDMVRLTNRLGVALGRSDVDLVDLRRADPLLLWIVAEEGVLLYESEAGAFTRFASYAARRFFDTRKFRELERQLIHDFLERSEARE